MSTHIQREQAKGEEFGGVEEREEGESALMWMRMVEVRFMTGRNSNGEYRGKGLTEGRCEEGSNLWENESIWVRSWSAVGLR